MSNARELLLIPRGFCAQRVSIMVRRNVSQGVVLDAWLLGKVQGERKTGTAQLRMLFSAQFTSVQTKSWRLNMLKARSSINAYASQATNLEYDNLG